MLLFTVLRIAQPPAKNLEKIFSNAKEIVKKILDKAVDKDGITLEIDKKYGGGKLKFSSQKEMKTFCQAIGELGKKL